MGLTRIAAIAFLPTLTVSTVLMMGSSEPLRAAAAGAPTARVTGVLVNPEVDEPGEYGPTLAFMTGSTRMKIGLLVESPKGGLIGFDHGASEVATFEDSEGNLLHDPKAHFGPFSMMDRVLADGAAIAIDLDGIRTPSPAATSVRARGTLRVRQAFNKATFTAPGRVPFTKGTSVKVGPMTLEILGSAKSSWGDDFELEVKTNDDISGVISWAVETPTGGRIELRPGSSMTMGKLTQLSLRSKVKLESGILSAEAWTDAKVVDVPFDVGVRVGVE